MRYLVVLLLVPLAAADPVDLELPAQFRMADAVVLSGRIEAPGLRLDNASIAGPHGVNFTGGALTVCPLDVPRASLVATLLHLGTDCPRGQTFQEPTVGFGPGTRLQAAGSANATLPEAAMAVASGNDSLALVLGGPLGWERGGDLTRFAVTNGAGSVWVGEGMNRTYFNGTKHAFLVDADRLRWDIDGVAARVDQLTLHVTPAGEAMARAYHPGTFADLQEAHFGPDEREPRHNVTRAMGEFGRIPAFVDGSILGRLQGTLDGKPLEGSLVLLRAERIELRRDGDRLQGEVDPRIYILPEGFSVAGGTAWSAPWMLGVVLWLAAFAVVILHRTPPRRGLPLRALWLGGWAVALFLADWRIQGLLGAGASTGGFPLFVFEAAAVTMAFLFVAAPVRTALGRIVPARRLAAAEAAWAGIWLFLVWLLPAHLLAWGFDVARL